MSKNLSLFTEEEEGCKTPPNSQPLADKMRPHSWEDLKGLAGLDPKLLQQLQTGRGKPPSLVLWGPPGCGKTTLAKLIGQSFDCTFEQLSAVLSGVKDIREVVERARSQSRPTLLFVDEVHRFNKGQQDAFLPHIESGLIAFIGATTENPSFYLNSALLSRVKVLSLPAHDRLALSQILQNAATSLHIEFEAVAADILLQFVGGDARRLLNAVEGLVESRQLGTGALVTSDMLREFLLDSHTTFYDRDGEEHYNVASAFIKSLRGSDPDAALFWGLWMLESGEDPRFLCRRMMIFASEDIGNADPRALPLALATAEAFERLGLPEGKIPISHCITYLACAPKSNRSYMAMKRVEQVLSNLSKVTVPLHLRNAPTGLMKSQGYGANYQYPHDNETAYVAAEQYLPDEIKGERFYSPSDHGLEKAIGEKLKMLRGLAGK